MDTQKGRGVRRQQVAGAVLAVIGGYLGVPSTILFPVGWLLSLAALVLLGRSISKTRRIKGNSPAFAWAIALGIVIGIFVLMWLLQIGQVKLGDSRRQ